MQGGTTPFFLPPHLTKKKKKSHHQPIWPCRLLWSQPCGDKGAGHRVHTWLSRQQTPGLAGQGLTFGRGSSRLPPGLALLSPPIPAKSLSSSLSLPHGSKSSPWGLTPVNHTARDKRRKPPAAPIPARNPRGRWDFSLPCHVPFN